MKEFVEFIQTNWSYLSFGIICLFELIIVLIKKRPMSLDEFQEAWNEALKALPHFIYSVEHYDDLSGEGKKEAVIQKALNKIQNDLGRELTEKEVDRVEGSISAMIEAILYCPTKKGGLGREQVEQEKK